MPSCGLAPGARLVAAACVRAVRQRLASVCRHERILTALRGFRREVAVRACAQQRRDTRVPLQARDSYPVADGPWGTDQATTIDVDTPAPRHPQPERCL
jgi:hypothetical protein